MKPRRLVLVLLVAAVAVALLSLAWPRLRSSLAYLPVETALKKHWHGEAIRPARYAELIASAEHSIAVHDQVRYREGLSWLYYLQALDLGAYTPEGQAALGEARRATVAVLERAPAKPAYWLNWLR